jgi:hypothetical protein
MIACIIVRLEGSISDHDLIDEQRRTFTDPLFEGHYSRLVDATEVTKFAVSAETVRGLATAAVERGLQKAALVSNDTELVSALMRTYEGQASPSAEVAVCCNMKEALQWVAQSIES